MEHFDQETRVEAEVKIMPKGEIQIMRGVIPNVDPQSIAMISPSRTVDGFFFHPDGIEAPTPEEKILLGRKYILHKILCII